MTCVKEKTGVVVKGKQVECLKRWKHTRHPPVGREIRRRSRPIAITRSAPPLRRTAAQPHSPLSGLWLSGRLTPHLHHNFAGITRGCAARLDDRSDVRLTRTAACNQFTHLYTSGQCNEGPGFSTDNRQSLTQCRLTHDSSMSKTNAKRSDTPK